MFLVSVGTCVVILTVKVLFKSEFTGKLSEVGVYFIPVNVLWGGAKVKST